MFTVCLDDITEAIGNVVKSTETIPISLNSLDQSVDVLLKVPNPLTETVRTTVNLVEAWINKIQFLLDVCIGLFEHCELKAPETVIMAVQVAIDSVDTVGEIGKVLAEGIYLLLKSPQSVT
ncbi:hypothetical protein CLAIMM_02787 [Cladophialophora immunda]|nr:hypothetical protein CLAIMM_02787 [Cladophialophora immunda]